MKLKPFATPIPFSALALALSLAACSSDPADVTIADSTIKAGNQTASAPPGPVVDFVRTAQPGGRRLIADPAFGGSVRVTKGDDYFAASGRKCTRFTVKQMSLMNASTGKFDERYVLCNSGGNWVLRHLVQ